MALVISDRDYKRVTILAKVAGIFLFSAGTIMLADHGEVVWALILVPLGMLAVLAPLPMTVLKPEGVAQEDLLTVNE